jgi:hypothetical protein
VAAKLLWNSADLAILTLVVGAVAAICVIWLYPPQTRTLQRRWQWLLPAMRLAALLLLVISLLKPTLVRPRTADEQAAVLVLVDRSASMGVADRDRPVGEQVALADALGELPAGGRTIVGRQVAEILLALKPQVDEVARLQGDLDYSRLSGSGEDRAARRLDESMGKLLSTAASLKPATESLQLDDGLRRDIAEVAKAPDEKGRGAWVRKAQRTIGRAEKRLVELQRESDKGYYEREASARRACEAISSASRLELVEKVVTMPQVGLLDALPGDVPLFGFALGDGVRPLPLRGNGQSVRQLGVTADALRTDLIGGIADAMDDVKGRQIQAAIVFTDGRQSSGGTTAAGQLGLRGIPVFAVAAGAVNSLRDLAIESLTAPTGPFVGETIVVRVGVRSLRLSAKDLEVKLAVGDVQQSRRIDVAADSVATAEFEVKLDKPGVQELTASIPELPGEATFRNNTAHERIKVHQDRVRVLAISGYATWDYQYIRNAVSRTAWARLTERIIDPGKILELSAEQIRQQDVILLFNVPARALRPEQIDEIHQAVTRGGASLLLTAEDPAMLDEYAAHPLLGELLPYRAGQRPVWRVWPGAEPAFRITPSDAVKNEDFMRLADDGETSRHRWAQTPAVYRYMVLGALKPNVIRPLLVERDSSLPVLTESRVGLGRVLFLGLDESWRWRRKVGERDQDRLWLQIIRYSAEEPYALTAGRLAMDLDRVAAGPGQPVKARVRVDMAGRPGSAGAQADLLIYQDHRLIRQEQLVPLSEYSPGRFEAHIRDLSDGVYEVQASLGAVGGEPAQTLRLPLSVGRNEQDELANVSPDLQLLDQIARATGGAVVNLEQARELPRRLSGLREKASATVEIALWDSAGLFLLVLSLLGAEWAIRKRLGLP